MCTVYIYIVILVHINNLDPIVARSIRLEACKHLQSAQNNSLGGLEEKEKL